jgi:hypothetical protein
VELARSLLLPNNPTRRHHFLELGHRCRVSGHCRETVTINDALLELTRAERFVIRDPNPIATIPHAPSGPALTQYVTPAPTAHQLGNQASTSMGYGHQGAPPGAQPAAAQPTESSASIAMTLMTGMKEAFTNMAGAFRGAGRRGGGHGHGRRGGGRGNKHPSTRNWEFKDDYTGCHICGKMDHMKMDCPKRRNRRGGSQ